MLMYYVGVTRMGCSRWSSHVRCVTGDIVDDLMGLAFPYILFCYDVAMVG
jgi:hypothetical protein